MASADCASLEKGLLDLQLNQHFPPPQTYIWEENDPRQPSAGKQQSSITSTQTYALFPQLDRLQLGGEAKVSQPQLHVLVDKEVA